MEKIPASLKEKFSAAIIPSELFSYDWDGNKIICPNCDEGTITFDEYHNSNGGEIHCPHCGEDLNIFHFMAKVNYNRNVFQLRDKEYQSLVKETCAKLGINHDILKPKNEIKPPTSEFKPPTADKPPTAEIKPPTAEFKPPTVAIIDTKKLFGENANEFFKNSLAAFILENQKFQYRKTGFSNLDAFQKFQPGIYILGGLPALGKTTFALQLLNQLAKQGETCIFCSFEMSKGYLYSKLLAQEINLLEHGGIDPVDATFGKTFNRFIKASDIIFGNFQYHEDEYKTVMKNFEKNPLPLYIWEIAEIDLNKILNRINQICKTLEKPPVVVIDYLQLLTGASDNQKSALDDTLHKLFNFRRATGTTFIIISSLNRMNYYTKINFESFCGSGGIEYSADVIWGLQFKLAKYTPDEAEKAKKEIPRKIELKCLKNRFGANYDVGFFYYPNMEIFRPLLEYNEINGTSKTKGVASRNEE